MSYEIVVKDVSPTLTLSQIEPCTLKELPQIIYDIQDRVKSNLKGSFICLTSEPFLSSESQLFVHCPVENTFPHISPKEQEYKVLQRTKVVSTIHAGEYTDLEEAFKTIHQYIEQNNLKQIFPYRLIFHKEKRKWQRKKFFRKSSQSYMTEVQAQIVNE